MNSLNIPEENLCNRCPAHIRGKCCYFSTWLIDDNQIDWKLSLSKHPCKYLNTKTGRCKVYKKRHEINPNCLTIKEMILLGTISKDCLYVKNNPQYQKRKDTVLLNLPSNIPETIKKDYTKYNNSPHFEVAIYDTLRSFICPKCESPHLKENWEERYSFTFCSYKCENCGYEWNNFDKQIQYSLKKLKEVAEI